MLNKIQSLRETLGKNYIRPDSKLILEYQKSLNETPHALEYLKGRGLNEETIFHFKLGYKKEFDSIAIPVFKDGELVNFKYRFLDPKDIKYTSEKGAETWIYHDEGLEHARKKGGVLIVEGEFDLMMCFQAGIYNVVSPASGKDSYAVWIEKLDNIPKIWIAYDNDIGGKDTALKLAERLGIEKCSEVVYPSGIKDANDFFVSHSKDDFKELMRNSKPFYTYRFKGLGDILNSMRKGDGEIIRLEVIPEVKIEKDWLLVVTGRSNVGKTSWILNVASELATQNIPTLIFPFERGIENVGKRFLQVRFEKTREDFSFLTEEEWKGITDECVDFPVYFSMPKKDEIIDTIIKSKRLFNTKFVIIDHLDYIVRHSFGSKEAEIGNTLQILKRIAEEHGIVMLIVTHVRKIDSAGSEKARNPNIEDLKGSSSLYQDPECVILLHGDGKNQMDVIVAKNKGKMSSKTFNFNEETGKLSPATDINDF